MSQDAESGTAGDHCLPDIGAFCQHEIRQVSRFFESIRADFRRSADRIAVGTDDLTVKSRDAVFCGWVIAESLDGHLAFHLRFMGGIDDNEAMAEGSANDGVFSGFDLTVRHSFAFLTDPEDFHLGEACVEDLQLWSVQGVEMGGLDEQDAEKKSNHEREMS